LNPEFEYRSIEHDISHVLFLKFKSDIINMDENNSAGGDKMLVTIQEKGPLFIGRTRTYESIKVDAMFPKAQLSTIYSLSLQANTQTRRTRSSSSLTELSSITASSFKVCTKGLARRLGQPAYKYRLPACRAFDLIPSTCLHILKISKIISITYRFLRISRALDQI
jgi:hypothetical protein